MSDSRDTVVVKDGGSSTGLLLGIIALIVILAAGWYFLIGPGAGTTSNPNEINVQVELPSAAPAAS
jgi:hypothetical protein